MNPGAVRYRLGARVLEVLADSPGRELDLDRMLGRLRLADAARPDFSIAVTTTPRLAEHPDGALVFDGALPVEGDCRMVEGADALHLIFPGSQTVTIASGRRRADIRVLPGVKVKWTAWMLALDCALDADGQTMLHMAGLTLPRRDAMVLVHAPSGTGKTTTALALASRGFGLCADDAMVLDAAQRPVSGWGLPRAVKIHRRTAMMIAALSPCLGPTYDSEGEQAVTLDRLENVVRVEAPASRPVLALLHLQRSGDGQTRLTPMPKTEAVAALAADNVRTGLTGLVSIQRRRLAAIASMAMATPTFLLAVGREPADAAALIEVALPPARETAPS